MGTIGCDPHREKKPGVAGRGSRVSERAALVEATGFTRKEEW
ncbi:MAG: hypothetical protein AB1646_25670 [Thermodesulfobacteriota bacterium]